jgi:hypothetical protein
MALQKQQLPYLTLMSSPTSQCITNKSVYLTLMTW